MRHAPRRSERPAARRRRAVAWATWSGLLAAATVAAAAPPSTKDREFFETRIRPVLITHCYECHGPESKDLGGGLRLDHRDGLRQGGQSGAAIVAGSPEESLLIHALRYAGPEMPPEAPLPEPVIRDFEEWVRRGAADPREAVVPTAITTTPTPPRSDLWSLQPVADPPPPAVHAGGWPLDPLDHFVLARIEAKGLAPTHDAPPRTLVRRLFVDLLGLPPTAAEIEAFEAAHAARGEAAVGELVDDLLARPQFGERWARHWLDVARYGESNGNDGLGYVPASKAGAELLFDVIATAYERNSLVVTTNLPVENWTEVLGSERLTGAALDRLTHRCHILETKGESYRLQDAKRRRRRAD